MKLTGPFIHLFPVTFDSELPTRVMRPKDFVVAIKSKLRISKQSQQTQHTLFFPVIQVSQESYGPVVVIAIPTDHFLPTASFKSAILKRPRT